jgi:excisionase family DNA binding protein
MDTENLLTVREAAERLGVSESAVRNATLDGRLPCVSRFGRKLILTEDLEAYRRRTQPGGVKLRGRPPRTEEKTA